MTDRAEISTRNTLLCSFYMCQKSRLLVDIYLSDYVAHRAEIFEFFKGSACLFKFLNINDVMAILGFKNLFFCFYPSAF